MNPDLSGKKLIGLLFFYRCDFLGLYLSSNININLWKSIKNQLLFETKYIL